MATEKTTSKELDTAAIAAPQQQQTQINIRLQPVENSDLPILSNFTMVQAAPGMVFVDFGFLEPNALPAIARLAQSGGKLPETLTGKLACRVTLGLDAAVQLTQQLEQQIQALTNQIQQAAAKN